MYIDLTTHNERFTMDCVLNGIICDLERANRVLWNVIEHYFLDLANAENISQYTEEISDLLYMVSDTLHNSLLNYDLMMGNESCATKAHIEGVERAKNVLAVNTALNEIREAQKRMPKADKLNYDKALKDAANLPDDTALPMLEHILQQM